jgi:hypothetical protein
MHYIFVSDTKFRFLRGYYLLDGEHGRFLTGFLLSTDAGIIRSSMSSLSLLEVLKKEA